MDKKLLVSLMMTAPVAAFAADVQWQAEGGDLSYLILPQVDSDNWSANGMVSSGEAKPVDGVLTCPVSVSTLTRNAHLTAIGSYTFKMDPNKCSNVVFKVNGIAQYEKDAQGNDIKTKPATTFTVVSDGSFIEIVAERINNDLPIQVGQATLTLNCEFDKISEFLNDEYNKVVFKEVNADDTRSQAKDLRERLAALVKKQKAVKSDIDAINLNSADALLNAWKNFELVKWNKKNPKDSDDTISIALRALQSATTTYNTDVDAENKAWGHIVANEASLKALNDRIKDLQAALDAKADVEKTIPANADAQLKEYAKLALAADLKAEQDSIDNLKKAVDAKFVKTNGYLPSDKTIDTKEFNDTADNIAADIAALSYDKAQKDWDAYKLFLTSLDEQASNFSKIFSSINENYRVSKYYIGIVSEANFIKNVYDDVTGIANNALAEAYKSNDFSGEDGSGLTPGAIVDGKLDKDKFELINDAYEKWNNSIEEQFKTRLNGMKAAETALRDIYNAQQAELNGPNYNPEKPFEYGEGSANAIIKGLQEKYNSYVEFSGTDAYNKLDKADKDKLAELRNAISEQITNLINETKRLYLAHELNVAEGDFVDAEGLVTDAIKAYKAKLDSIGTAVIDLMEQSNALKDYVEETIDKASVGNYGQQLKDKFTSSFENINEAIDMFYHGSNKTETSPAYRDIINAMDVVKDVCDKLVPSFETAVAALSKDDTALKSFKYQLDNKLLIAPAFDKTSYNEKYDEYKAKYDANETSLNNIANNTENVQDDYQKALKLAQDITTAKLNETVSAEEKAFVNAATKQNLDNVETKIIDIKKYMGLAPYEGATAPDGCVYATMPGMSKVDIVKGFDGKDLQSVIDLYNAQASAYQNNLGNSKGLATIDNALKQIVDKFTEVDKKVKAVLDNHTAYEALKSLKAGLVQSINDYDIEANTNAPAAAHYNAEFGSLLSRLDVIEGKYNTSYQNETEVNDQDGYENEISGVQSDFDRLKKELVNNQENFDDLSNMSDRLSNQINEDNKTLAEYDGVGQFTADAQTELERITKALGHLNDEVTIAFGNGELIDSKTAYADFVKDYEDLTAELEKIFQDWSDGYREAVKAANESWMSNHQLGTGDKNVNADYVAAIEYVNEYLYNLNNSTYRDLITNDPTFKENHNRLQQCYKQIETLNKIVNAWLSKLTPNSSNFDDIKVLGDPDNKPLETQKTVTVDGVEYTVNENNILTADGKFMGVETILNTIKDCKAKIDARGLVLADEFWKANGEVAYTTWGKIGKRLRAAGFSTEGREPGEKSDIDMIYGTQYNVLNSMIDAQAKGLEDIANAKNADEKETYTHKYILDMDMWADWMEANPTARSFGSENALLPGFNPTDAALTKFINDHVYAGVNTLWSSRVENANTKLNDLLTELQGTVEKEGYTLDPKYDEHKAVITDALNEIASLNNSWSLLSDPTREKTLPINQSIISGLLEKAKTAVADAKAAHELVKNNNEVYQKVISNEDSPYKLAEKNLQWLYEWSGYREDQLKYIDAYAQALESAKNAVIAGTKDNSSTKATVAGATATIEAVSVTQFATVCDKVFQDEYKFADEEMMVLLRSAFNNVKLAGVADSQLDGWDEQIKELERRLNACTYKPLDKDGCMSNLKGIEAEISTLLVELQALAQSVATTDTKAEALDALDKASAVSLSAITNFQNEVKNAKEEGKATYVKAAQTEANTVIAGLNKELEDIKAAYVAAEQNVIQDAAWYEYQLSNLNDKTADALKTWNTNYANALKKDISDDQYNILKTQLDNLWEKTQEARGEAMAHHDTFDYASYMHIDRAINGWTDEDGTKYIGWLDYYKSLSEKFEITRNDNVDNLAKTVGNFVRTTLQQVASNQQTYIEDSISDLINAVKEPAANPNGFAQAYYKAAEIIDNLTTELSNVQTLSLKPIVQKYVNSKPVATDPTEAFTAYNTILEILDGYAATAGSIKDNADDKNLFVPGDVTGEGKVNILDVQALINDIAKGAKFDPTDKKSLSSDLTEDEDINIGDVTKLINVILKQDETGRNSIISKVRKFMLTLGGSNSYSVYEVQGENGLRRFAVLLTNETTFAAGQIDIKLPSHASVAGVSLGERANGLDTYTSDNGDYTRVVFTSLDNTLIEGNNGCVLFIDVEGNAEVEVENVIFSDKNGKTYKLNSNNASGVGILDSVKDGVKAIYNAAGQKLNKLNKGVNIIRNADGSVTKKMGK